MWEEPLDDGDMILHQKRERCKGNRQKERGAVATDYIQR
jgi:hypothetical protein